MNFIAPEFLYALSILIFPILIHLFNFRRFKTVYFSQVRFLKNIKQETQSTSKLKHLLVLISRCLAITTLVFAFAQPYFPSKETYNNQGKKGVSIYLDNSFSMLADESEGSLLEVAKNKALTITKAYSASDRFQLLTNNFGSNEQRWMNRENFILALQAVEETPIFRTLNQVQNRMNQTANDEGLILERYLISDLQQVNVNFSELKDTAEYYIIPVQSQNSKNLNLSHLSFSTPFHLPNQLENIALTIKNEGKNEALEIPTQMFLNNKLKSPFVVNLPEQDSIIRAFSFRNPTSNQLNGKLVIKDYPLTFDDTLYFSYPIQSQIKVLSLFEEQPNPNISALFLNDSLIQFKNEITSNINYQQLASNQLIILDQVIGLSSALRQELKKFVSNGGSLGIFPNSEMNLKEVNDLLSSLSIGTYNSLIKSEAVVASINQQADLFKEVFDELPKNIQLPRVSNYWNIRSQSRTLVERLMEYRNGKSFISLFRAGKGKVYLSSVGLLEEQSNLVNHAIFVPLLYNMALQAGIQQPNYYSINQSSFRLPMSTSTESPIHITGHGLDFIPAQQYLQNELKIELGDEIKKAGHYQLVQNENIIGQLSFNYDRKESQVDTYTPQEFMELAAIEKLNFQLLNEKNDVLRSKIEKIDQGTPLWKYFIILALIFIAIEIILLRYLK